MTRRQFYLFINHPMKLIFGDKNHISAVRFSYLELSAQHAEKARIVDVKTCEFSDCGHCEEEDTIDEEEHFAFKCKSCGASSYYFSKKSLAFLDLFEPLYTNDFWCKRCQRPLNLPNLV